MQDCRVLWLRKGKQLKANLGRLGSFTKKECMSKKKKLGFLKYVKPIDTAKTRIIRKEVVVEKQQEEYNPLKFAQYKKRDYLYPSEITITKFKYSNQDWRFLKSNEFLESFEWRKLRLQALLLHGRKCLCCGASPETNAVLNVDHIKPRKTNPELALDINNLQVLCKDCNHGKGNWNTTDFR